MLYHVNILGGILLVKMFCKAFLYVLLTDTAAIVQPNW